jgi:hypothetical protein
MDLNEARIIKAPVSVIAHSALYSRIGSAAFPRRSENTLAFAACSRPGPSRSASNTNDGSLSGELLL